MHERVTSLVDHGNYSIRQKIGARITGCKEVTISHLVKCLFKVQGEFKHRGDNGAGSSTQRHFTFRRNYLQQIYNFPKRIAVSGLMVVHTSFDFP